MRLHPARAVGLLRAPWIPGWSKDPLWRRARAVPSLDLRFADNKSLVDATTGANLVTFTRASSGTYVDSQGVIRTATTNLCLRSEDITTTWTNFQSVDVADTAIAPNGTLTADTLVVDNAASIGLIQQGFTLPDSLTYTFSVYIKAAGIIAAYLQFYNKANTFHGTRVLNLTTGELTGSDTTGTSSVVAVGDGWYRFILSGLNSGAGATAPNVRIVANGTGNGTAGIYIWGAQLEQSSTVGEYVPTGATINSAPRFDHNPTTGESLGLLVEEQRSNLCLQSEAFGTSPWAASNVTVTANTATSPAATLTADTLAATSANGTVTQPVTTTAVAMTFSVYLKRKTGTGNIDITADGSTWVTQTINSSTWTRCIVTQTAVAGTSNPGIRIVTSGDEVYAWGGQYE